MSKQTHRIIASFLSLIVAFALASCNDPAPKPVPTPEPNPNPKKDKVTEIVLTPKDAKLTEGETLQLQVKLTPALEHKVIFTSSDANIASVDDKGTITAQKEGKAVITAKVDDVSATCSVEVTKKNVVPAKSFELTDLRTTGSNASVMIKPADKNMRYMAAFMRRTIYDRHIQDEGSINAFDLAFWKEATKKPDGTVNEEQFKKAIMRDSNVGEKVFDEKTNNVRYPFPDDHDIVFVIYGVDPDTGKAITEEYVLDAHTQKRIVNENLTFKVDITDVKATSAKVVVTPSDPNTTWFWSVQTKRFVDFYIHPTKDIDIEGYATNEDYMVFEKLLTGIYANDFDKIAVQKGKTDISELLHTNSANTDYVLIIFGWDEVKGITSKVEYIDFRSGAN